MADAREMLTASIVAKSNTNHQDNFYGSSSLFFAELILTDEHLEEYSERLNSGTTNVICSLFRNKERLGLTKYFTARLGYGITRLLCSTILTLCFCSLCLLSLFLWCAYEVIVCSSKQKYVV